MLLTGTDRAELAALAKAVASLPGTSWVVDTAPFEACAEHCRQQWPDVVVVHTSGLEANALGDALRWFHGSARLPVLVLTHPEHLKQRLVAVAANVDDDATT